jgi:hypothetical protein
MKQIVWQSIVVRQNAIRVESRLLTGHACQRKRYGMSRDRQAGTPLPSFVFIFLRNTRTQS